MPLHDLTSILCIALIIVLTMIYWSAYQQTIAGKKQQSDYLEQLKTHREQIERHEKILTESDRQTVLHGKLLGRQEMILTRVENLVAIVEKSLNDRSKD